MTLTAERLREVLNYDPETGWFTWRVRGRGRKMDRRAGCQKREGYRTLRLHDLDYYEHRLAVLYQTGSWPPQEVDHTNLVKNDNRWGNLRLATRSENGGNVTTSIRNTSGVKGVSWFDRCSKWKVKIVINGRAIHLGYFNSIETAAAAYSNAANDHFGEYARCA